MPQASPAGSRSGERWTAKAGAWLGIGSSPAALVMGAGMAARHDGPAPLLALLAGALLMAAMLYGQGMLGLAPPFGHGATLSALAPAYLRPRSHRAVNGLLAAAMVGWLGFNIGLGGAALAALVGLSQPLGVLALGGPVIVVAFGGISRWNPLAVVTTVSALILVALVTARLAELAVPVTGAVGEFGGLVADVAAFAGYAAVFSVRAPDFTSNLGRRSDLVACVALLVIPTVLVALAGVALQRGTGSADVVATLAAPDGLPIGNLLVAVAVVAAILTALYSGSLALRAVAPFGGRSAMLAVALPSLALAVARFDLYLLPWLGLLAASLPPLIVPMATEGRRRRRGQPPRPVPLWTWAPASLAALALTVAAPGLAPLLGLAAAGALTAAWHLRARKAGAGLQGRGYTRGS